MIILRGIIIFVLVVISSSNLSASEQGFYIGADIGLSSVDGVADAKTEAGAFPPEEISVAGVPFDDEDFLWQAFAGYRINRYVSVQVGYANLGEFQQFRNAIALGSDPAVLTIEELSLSAKFQYPLTEKASANWWLGMSQSSFDVDGHVRLRGLPSIPGDPLFFSKIPFSAPSNETGYLWGFGFNWKFTPRISIDLNYLMHDVQVVDVETINLGFIVEL